MRSRAPVERAKSAKETEKHAVSAGGERERQESGRCNGAGWANLFPPAPSLRPLIGCQSSGKKRSTVFLLGEQLVHAWCSRRLFPA